MKKASSRGFAIIEAAAGLIVFSTLLALLVAFADYLAEERKVQALLEGFASDTALKSFRVGPGGSMLVNKEGARRFLRSLEEKIARELSQEESVYEFEGRASLYAYEATQDLVYEAERIAEYGAAEGASPRQLEDEMRRFYSAGAPAEASPELVFGVRIERKNKGWIENFLPLGRRAAIKVFVVRGEV